MQVTSCEEETRILFNLFPNPPKLFYYSKIRESWRNTSPKTLKSNELSGLVARARRWNEISAE
jgi:hypothetical protein